MEKKDQDYYIFTLYISGMNSHSMEAVKNMTEICEAHLAGCYKLKIVDLKKEPDRAQTDHILAMPLLIKTLPLPVTQVIGDLSNKQKVMITLEIASE